MAIISEAGRQEGWEINNHHRLVLAVLPNNAHCIINRQNNSHERFKNEILLFTILSACTDSFFLRPKNQKCAELVE